MPPAAIARRALLALPALAAARAMAGPPRGRADGLAVFAAASLAGALDEALLGWEAVTGVAVGVSYAGSAALARQIEQGAPADLALLAHPGWMDALEAQGLIEPESRRDLLSNRLVLIGHGEGEAVEIGPGLDLLAQLGPDGRLAMGLVDAVPAGLYGRAALVSLGLWDAVEPRVVQADSARAALALVARGEAPLGIVYATDARAEPRVTALGRFPEASHPRIRYPAAVVRGAGPGARALLDHLASARSHAVFERHGFLIP